MKRDARKVSLPFIESEERLRNQHRFAEAVRVLQAGAGRLPDVAELHFRLGWLHEQLENPDAMRSSFKRFLTLDSEVGRPHRFLALTALEDYAGAAREGERFLRGSGTKGIDRLFHPWVEDWFPPRPDEYYAIRLKRLDAKGGGRRRSPWSKFLRGLLLSHLGRTRQSLAELGPLAELPGKRYGWMRYAAGLQKLRLGWYADAIDDFQAATVSRPAFWIARGHLAEAKLCLGRIEEGLREFHRGESHWESPAPPAELWAWRGESLLWLGRYQDALLDLELASRAGSTFAVCWKGAALMLMGRYSAARKDLDRAAATGWRDMEIFLWRGELNRRTKRYQAAIYDLDRAIEVGGGTWARVNRALTYAALGRRAKMWADFEKVPGKVLERAQGESDHAGLGRLDDKRVVRLLEAALGCARGVRRPEAYVSAIWISSRSRNVRKTKKKKSPAAGR